MTAFDTAWPLLKMPVVPSSYKDDEYHPTAEFEDPETGEILPIYATQHPRESEKIAFILNRGGLSHLRENRMFPPSPFGPSERPMPLGDDIRAHVKLRQNDGDGWSPELSTTEKPYRRRGYATALYDVLARMVADRDSEPRLHSTSATGEGGETLDDGYSFWQGAREKGIPNPDGSWRVRDDL